MNPEQMLEQLPVLLGAGAGAAAKGAAGSGGKLAFDRLRERLRRDQPDEAERLDRLAAELSKVSELVAGIAHGSDEVQALVDELSQSIDVTIVAGSELVNFGRIDKSVIARDITTLKM